MDEMNETVVPPFDALAALDVIMRKLLGPPNPDCRPGDADFNDPPSGAADMLDAILQDAPETYPGLMFSDIADTNPGGVGEAAVTVHVPTTGERFLIVCMPLAEAEAILEDGV